LKILSFDTSTSEPHLSISEGDAIVASEVIPSDAEQRQYAASALIPAIDVLLKKHRWSRLDIDALAVGIGPGGFTGVRVGVVTARTLAQALKLPLCGVSIFDCYWRATQADPPAGIIIDAGGNFFYVASYSMSAEREVIEQPQCVSREELKSSLTSNHRWLVSPSVMKEVEGFPYQFSPLPTLNNIAALQCEIASHRLSFKGFSSLSGSDRSAERERMMGEFFYELVRPLYLREPSITLKSFAN